MFLIDKKTDKQNYTKNQRQQKHDLPDEGKIKFVGYLTYLRCTEGEDLIVAHIAVYVDVSIMGIVTAHFVAPTQFVAGDKLYLGWQHILSPPCTIWHLAIKCAAVVHTVLGRQNVPCKSAYFVVPHRMDLNIHSDIYLLNMKEALYYILWYVYIIFITYLHLH